MDLKQKSSQHASISHVSAASGIVCGFAAMCNKAAASELL